MLCIVERALKVEGRGVVVTPRLGTEECKPHKFDVSLLRPDGSAIKAQAHVSVPGSSPPMPRPAVLALSDVSPEDVPPGTEVWLHEEQV
jgi:hypothetical protein